MAEAGKEGLEVRGGRRPVTGGRRVDNDVCVYIHVGADVDTYLHIEDLDRAVEYHYIC